MGQKNQDFKLASSNSSLRWLIRAPNWLGDWVMSLPFFASLRAHQPHAHIGVIVKDSLYSLSCAHLPVNECYAFSKEDFKGLKGLWRFGRRLRGRYDVYVSLPPSLSSAVMGVCSGAQYRIGYRSNYGRFFFTHSLCLPKDTHRSADYLALLAHSLTALGLPNGSIATSAPRMRLLSTKTPSVRLPTKKKCLIVSLHAEGESRTMPLQAATALLCNLLRLMPVQLCFIGTKAQYNYYQALKEALRFQVKALNLSGKTSISTLPHLLLGAQLVLATDSGIAHLAQALGVPTLVLFGAGNETKTAPGAGHKQPKLRILRAANVYCAPCQKNYCRFGDTHCLQQLSISEITRAAQQLWQLHT